MPRHRKRKRRSEAAYFGKPLSWSMIEDAYRLNVRVHNLTTQAPARGEQEPRTFVGGPFEETTFRYYMRDGDGYTVLEG